MKPIRFKESTTTLGRPRSMTDEECGSLPVFRDDHRFVSCWKGDWKERLKFLFTGKVWLGVVTQGQQPPVWNTVHKPFDKGPGWIERANKALGW